MGIGASTHVKEIRIDQNDEKWNSPSAKVSRKGSRNFSFTKRWVASADGDSANNRRNKNLGSLLEAAEKRSSEAEQRIRQLEREVASLELKKMELSEEVQWLKKQLSERIHTNVMENSKIAEAGLEQLKHDGGAGHRLTDVVTSSKTLEQLENSSLLERQAKRHEEDLLKLKTKLTRDLQKAQLSAENERVDFERKHQAVETHLHEAESLNRLYEGIIKGRLSPQLIEQTRSSLHQRSSFSKMENEITENNDAQLSGEVAISHTASSTLNDDIAALHASLSTHDFRHLIDDAERQPKNENVAHDVQNSVKVSRPIFSATRRRGVAAASRRRHSIEPIDRQLGEQRHSPEKDQRELPVFSKVHMPSKAKRGDDNINVLDLDEQIGRLPDHGAVSKSTTRIISSHGRKSKSHSVISQSDSKDSVDLPSSAVAFPLLANKGAIATNKSSFPITATKKGDFDTMRRQSKDSTHTSSAKNRNIGITSPPLDI